MRSEKKLTIGTSDSNSFLAVKKICQEASKLRQEGNFSDALRLALAGLDDVGRQPEVICEIAECHFATKNWHCAAEYWDEFLNAPLANVRLGTVFRIVKSFRLDGQIARALDLSWSYFDLLKNSSSFLQEAIEVGYVAEGWTLVEAAASALERIPGKGLSQKQVLRVSFALCKLGKFPRATEFVVRGLIAHPEEVELLNERDEIQLRLMIREGRVDCHTYYISDSKSGTKSVDCTVSDICDYFWALEQELSLPSWKVNDVYPWTLFRMDLYYKITQLVGLFTAPHPNIGDQFADISDDERKAVADGWSKKLEEFLGRNINELKTKIAKERCSAIVTLKKIVGGSEPYSDALRRELGERALILEKPLAGESSTRGVNIVALLDHFRREYRDPLDARICCEDLVILQRIRSGFAKKFGIDVGDLIKPLKSKLLSFCARERGMKLFFEAYDIGTLYLTVSYGASSQAMISAARSLGVRVVELQHGFISRYHLGYSWPYDVKIAYSPDELWTFGDFWATWTPLCKGMASRSIGAPYVQGLAKLNNAPRDERLVVFTSQGVVGTKIFELALGTAKRRPDYNIVFRLHPSEILDGYQELMANIGSIPSNFSLSHRDPNIFALLAQAGVQVGAFSTTLFEGMALGTRTIVVDLPGVEYMLPVLECGDALFVLDLDELVASLDDAPLAKDPSFYYRDPVTNLTDH